jgi:hypothetical protein
MSKVPRWSAALSGALGLFCLAAVDADASENATFECAAGPSQLCHFSIVRQPGGLQNFVIQGRQRTVVSGLAPGRDWYLVTVNQPTPAYVAACQQASFRCKAAIVRRGLNQ